jgi:putative heme-binding domain-containing protein
VHKNVRRECINSIGNLLALGQDVEELLGILLDNNLGMMSEPLARSTRGNKMIPVREAYDREYERYLTRMFLERQPEVTSKFLSSAAAKNLPAESQLLAALALPPAQGALIISGQLAGLKRAPNSEEVLRLVQALDQPQIQQSLQAGIANPATSQTIIDALLKNKNRIPAERMQSLLTSAVDQLFKGNAEEVQRAVALSSAFSLTNTAEKLLAIAQAAGPAENRIAALDAIATQQNGDPVGLFAIYQNEKDSLQLAAVRALASSRHPQAASQALGIFTKIGPALQRQVLESLCTNKEGAQALVKACLDGKVPTKSLNSIAIDRLQVVLHDDPSLKKMLDGLSDIYRPVLSLNGNENSFVATNISLPGAFTVETWVKLNPEIDNRVSLGGAPDQLDLNFFGSTFRIYAFGAANDLIVAKKQTIAGLWTHIAAVRDDKGNYKIYINGELDNAVSKTLLHKIENFRIGWSSPNGGSNEQLAEFRIWNRERSAAEIRANFDRSLAKTKDSSLLYNGSGDQGWGALNEHTSISRTTNLPPVMSLEQSAAFDKKYQHMLTLAQAGGKVEQGKTLAAACMGCHQFGNTGGQIGPNLSSVGAMGPEAIVRNILTPNAAIEPGYRIFRVEMKDGSLVDAFFISEDKDAILVRQMGAGDKRIERKNIQSTQFLRQSLMPEGLLDAYSDDQIKDLFSFLMSLK